MWCIFCDVGKSPERSTLKPDGEPLGPYSIQWLLREVEREFPLGYKVYAIAYGDTRGKAFEDSRATKLLKSCVESTATLPFRSTAR